uniref:Uncharacterized protein n=1 Tax=Rousettus aegyptiacus TaxID=9407 RepID=A0A7J8JG49_ROUAE|nr:hypothetical protein HJG63_010199 [Rousettus aegyptiacus]
MCLACSVTATKSLGESPPFSEDLLLPHPPPCLSFCSSHWCCPPLKSLCSWAEHMDLELFRTRFKSHLSIMWAWASCLISPSLSFASLEWEWQLGVGGDGRCFAQSRLLCKSGSITRSHIKSLCG